MVDQIDALLRQPTDLDRRFIEIRQWLTAEGEYSDLIVEQGSLQDDDLQTETMVMQFHYNVDQALKQIDRTCREKSRRFCQMKQYNANAPETISRNPSKSQ